jgi:phosphoribosylglycinamide formyltransferase 1
VQRPARLVVLASGGGTTLQALLDDDEVRPHVVAVGSDRADAGALDRARAAGLPAFVVPFADQPDRERWNRDLEQALAAHEPDLVVLAGFLRIVDAANVRRFRMLNTHPALLPAFPGVGIRAVRAALAAGVKISGVTVHWVDEGVDTGPIVAQAAVPVLDGDDEHTLFDRIKAVEKPLFVDTVRGLCAALAGAAPRQETR